MGQSPALVLAGLLATAGSANANTEAQFAAAFDFWCGTGMPSFTAVAQKAGAKKLAVVQHQKMPVPGGNWLESQMWSVEDATGKFALNAMQGTNRGKKMDSCSVYFPDLASDTLQDRFGKALKLGTPRVSNLSPDGKHITFWRTKYPDVEVMLTSGSKGGGPEGATVILIQSLEPRK